MFRLARTRVHTARSPPTSVPPPSSGSSTFVLGADFVMGGGEVNYVHEDEIWRQQMKTEVEVAGTWGDNWGFLTGKEQPDARGFSQKVAKYAYAGGKWTVKQVRVPDDTQEGTSAAESEQTARKMMTGLAWDTRPVAPTKPCESKVRAVSNLIPSIPHKAMLVCRYHVPALLPLTALHTPFCDHFVGHQDGF